MTRPWRQRAETLAAIGGLTVLLTACGGGGGGGAPALLDVETDPRVVRLEGIVDRADTLRVSDLYGQYTVSAQGTTVRDRLALAVSCAGTRCVIEGGEVIDLQQELRDPAVSIEIVENLGTFGGFDTATIRSRIDLSDRVPDVTVTAAPSVYTFGFWGKHGGAAVLRANGSLSGRTQGVPFTGDLSMAGAYVFGEATGTNPTGFGSATWRGVAEAAPTGSFIGRRQGTATITIPDLLAPRVGVEITVGGRTVGSWANLPLRDGAFAGGTPRRNRVEGAFYGSGHEETYGLFDTDAYVGAFGATRQ